MSDPAIEAAQRAWESEGWGSGNLQLAEGSLATAAAREALKPIREAYKLWGRPESAEAFAIMAELSELIFATEELP